MADVSICIPTYNRANILDETLAHLVECRQHFEFELVITDNASEDATAQVVDKYRDHFHGLIYHRHSENIGAVLNSSSVMGFATSKLLYILSDDDRLVPETICKIINMFKEDGELVAIYANHCEFDPYTGEESDTFMNIITKQVFTPSMRASMFEQFGMLWGGVVRTDISQRFVYYDDTTFGFWRTIEMLFKHGSIAVIPDLLYKHAMTVPRMENRLIEPWYHDSHRSDFELYVAGLGMDCSDPGRVDNIVKFVHDRCRKVYLFAFDSAGEQQKYLMQRHYLLRARCYGLMPDHKVKQWEENFILHCVLERIETILKGLPDVREIVFESSDFTDLLLRFKSQKRFSALPDIEVLSSEELIGLEIDDSTIIMAMEYSTLERRNVRKKGHEFSLFDMISTLRVTTGNLNIIRG